MFFLHRYTVVILLCFAGFGICHPGFGLGILFGVGGTTVVFGGVIAIAAGVMLNNLYKDIIQAVAEPLHHPPLPQISTPRHEDGVDEEVNNGSSGIEHRITRRALASLDSCPEAASRYLQPGKGLQVSPSSPSSSTGSAGESELFSGQLDEEGSVNTSIDDAQTVVPDREEKEDDPTDIRNDTPIPERELLSHLGKEPEIARDIPNSVDPVISTRAHRYFLPRTRSDEIESGANSSIDGVVALATDSHSDAEEMHGSDRSTESTVEPPDWSDLSSGASSVNGEMETQPQIYHQTPRDLDGSVVPQAAAAAPTTSDIPPSSETLSHRAQRNWSMVQTVDAVMEIKKIAP